MLQRMDRQQVARKRSRHPLLPSQGGCALALCGASSKHTAMHGDLVRGWLRDHGGSALLCGLSCMCKGLLACCGLLDNPSEMHVQNRSMLALIGPWLKLTQPVRLCAYCLAPKTLANAWRLLMPYLCAGPGNTGTGRGPVHAPAGLWGKLQRACQGPA